MSHMQVCDWTNVKGHLTSLGVLLLPEVHHFWVEIEESSASPAVPCHPSASAPGSSPAPGTPGPHQLSPPCRQLSPAAGRRRLAVYPGTDRKNIAPEGKHGNISSRGTGDSGGLRQGEIFYYSQQSGVLRSPRPRYRGGSQR